ncbi:pentatricopeptide repeat-containing protein At4g02750 [Selaginella moellendorffii]|uniref:pentatricopeptide repeat-containing protein At4g02750 n=1 Tax=Selaginella moellendorffii TaxID=88036 RepID=UPI000D1C30E3|nr:pentatricopeptide repeat-containing protein At4g02750 [Selaginella moellendorffii]|eukprot:XP_024532289.1 pentatricopeptide repeat-containing protein At4g02750 [Selaginella moellendorffii]
MALVLTVQVGLADNDKDLGQERFCSNTEAYAALLRRCANERNLVDGKRVHEHLRRYGYENETFLGNLLVQMYGKCSSIDDAALAFDSIRKKDLFSWNIMIAAFAENGCLDRAVGVFKAMPDRDVVSWNAVIAAYANNGQLDGAFQIFAKVPQKNAVSWNVLIAAYAQNGYHRMAFILFWTMSFDGTRPNEISFINILELCSIGQGRIIHSVLVSTGLLVASAKVANAVITMFGECGSVEEAELVFQGVEDRDVVTWTAMVAAYAQNGQMDEARSLFDRMPVKNVVSWNAMISAYAQAGHTDEALEVFELMEPARIKRNRGTFVAVLAAGLDLEQGKKIHDSVHSSGLERNEMVATALLSMYGACGSTDDARQVFEQVPKLDLVCWNAMITAYVQNDRGREALEIFHRLEMEGVKCNEVTYLAALDACACLAVQSEGRSLHKRVSEAGLLLTSFKVANSLINMYGKSGNLEAAEEIFESMPSRDISSWNVLLTVYGHNGLGDLAVDRFTESCLEGFEPDSITFLAVLQACSHAGLLDTGVELLVSIQEDWGIDPTQYHYLCVVDLLGRSGELVRAEALINSMPFEPEEGAWRSLLGGCRVNSDVGRGERATQRLLVMSEDSSPYVLMANIYASIRNFDLAERLRSVMADRNVKKQPGLSWIEVRGRIHTFAANDKLHARKEEIYAGLDRLFVELQREGYRPDTRVALYDVEEEKKVRMLLHHSEKLAIMFGLMSTPDGSPLFVLKNLRVCADCHAATKIIAKITKRKIVMRDASRFHHFENGKCSCCDYW